MQLLGTSAKLISGLAVFLHSTAAAAANGHAVQQQADKPGPGDEFSEENVSRLLRDMTRAKKSEYPWGLKPRVVFSGAKCHDLFENVKLSVVDELDKNFTTVFRILAIKRGSKVFKKNWHGCKDPRALCSTVCGIYKAIYGVSQKHLYIRFKHELGEYRKSLEQCLDRVDARRCGEARCIPESLQRLIGQRPEMTEEEALALLLEEQPYVHSIVESAARGGSSGPGCTAEACPRLGALRSALENSEEDRLFDGYKHLWMDESMRRARILVSQIKKLVLLTAAEYLVWKSSKDLEFGVDCSNTLETLCGLLSRVSGLDASQQAWGLPSTAPASDSSRYNAEAGAKYLRSACLKVVVRWVRSAAYGALRDAMKYYGGRNRDARVSAVYGRFFGEERWKDPTVKKAMSILEDVKASTSNDKEKIKVRHLTANGNCVVFCGDALYGLAVAAVEALNACKDL